MIDRTSMATIRRDRRRGSFVLPDYGRYSLAEIVPTVLALFGVDSGRALLPDEVFREQAAGCDRVVLLMVDGLGYSQLTDHQEQLALFGLLGERGNVYALTSVFPSTTAAALTTLHTGFTPREHGLLEWTLYFEQFDAVVETLPFKPLGGRQNDSLLRKGADPRLLFDGPTVYERLAAAGVTPYCFNHQSYARSAYSSTVGSGSQSVAYGWGADLVVALRRLLATVDGPAYFFVYWPQVDSVEHRYGPHTEEHLVELSMLSHLFKAELLDRLDRRAAERTLLLLTADHGQVRVQPEEIVYLNDYPPVVDAFERSPKGKPIPPTGSPRDVFLHLKPECQATTMAFLAEELEGRAQVLTVDQAEGLGMFGVGEPSPYFRSRAGNTLILPYDGHHVWYRHTPGRTFELRGHHGGLTEAEMLVPLVVARLSDLLV